MCRRSLLTGIGGDLFFGQAATEWIQNQSKVGQTMFDRQTRSRRTRSSCAAGDAQDERAKPFFQFFVFKFVCKYSKFRSNSDRTVIASPNAGRQSSTNSRHSWLLVSTSRPRVSNPFRWLHTKIILEISLERVERFECSAPTPQTTL